MSETSSTPLLQDVYGGFWLRVVASLIDGLILQVANFVLGMVMAAANSVSGLPNRGAKEAVILLALNWIYSAYFESSLHQATPGKRIMGLKVTTINGDRLNFFQATIRYFGKIVSSLALGIGFIMVAFTQKKQGLHDLIAGTLVVHTRKT